MTLQNRITNIRKTTGKTQKEMALLVGVGLRTWQQYEEGGHEPSWKVVTRLSELGFNADWLASGEGEMKRGEKAEQGAGVAGLPRMTATARLAKGMAFEGTATGRLAAAANVQTKQYLEAFDEYSKRYTEIGHIVNMITGLNDDNVFKLGDIVEYMLNSQEPEIETAAPIEQAAVVYDDDDELLRNLPPEAKAELRPIIAELIRKEREKRSLNDPDNQKPTGT